MHSSGDSVVAMAPPPTKLAFGAHRVLLSTEPPHGPCHLYAWWVEVNGVWHHLRARQMHESTVTPAIEEEARRFVQWLVILAGFVN